MSVAVSCNLPDGVILGVDSAVTVPAPAGGVAKVFENAEKLFQLGDRPIGVATFGLGGFENRSIGSYLRQWESQLQDLKLLGEMVESLRAAFCDLYHRTIVTPLEATGRRFEDILPANRPFLGLVVGGFSEGQPLSEVWEILIPNHAKPNEAIQVRGQGDFSTNWFSLFEPINRYVLGYDRGLLDELCGYFHQLRGAPFSPEEVGMMQQVLRKYEYGVPFFAMPLEEGVKYTRFLVELVINHHRYAYGAPVVGGSVRIGKVSYKGERFQILD